MVSYNGLLINRNWTASCTKAKALVDWIYWTQSDSQAAVIAERNGITTAGKSPGVLSRILTQLTKITCNGVQVSSIATCVNDGELCSNHGTCTSGRCVCSDGWEGTYCEGTHYTLCDLLNLNNANQRLSESTSSSDDTMALALGISLGVGIPCLLILLLIALAVVITIALVKARRGQDNWEISPNELEIEGHLGTRVESFYAASLV